MVAICVLIEWLKGEAIDLWVVNCDWCMDGPLFGDERWVCGLRTQLHAIEEQKGRP